MKDFLRTMLMLSSRVSLAQLLNPENVKVVKLENNNKEALFSFLSECLPAKVPVFLIILTFS